MEYKEVVKKDGSILVFCNFEELLTEAFNVSTIEEVETFAKVGGEEYICHCPFCKAEGHTKHKLYIKTDLTVGHCFVCDRNYINVTDKGTVIDYQVPDFLGMFGGYQGFNLVKLNHPVWTIDKYKYEFDDYSEIGYNYLLGRHKYLGELSKILCFKYMDDNVVIPFFYKSEPIYYQIRFTGNSKIRYFLPPISNKCPYIIHREGIRKIIICEGVFDAIALLILAPDYIPCAILGSSISDYQIEFIREYIPEKILVYLDETKLSIGVAKKLKTVIDYCPIGVIKSEGEDPEENLKRRINFGQNLQCIK